MNDQQLPRRFQTRLNNRPRADSSTDEFDMTSIGSQSPLQMQLAPPMIEPGSSPSGSSHGFPLRREQSGSANGLSLEKVFTNSSYVLGNAKKRATDQILLDQLQSCDVVVETKQFETKFLFFRGPLSSYNSIRETYRLMADSKR
jgi:hypothetical protein